MPLYCLLVTLISSFYSPLNFLQARLSVLHIIELALYMCTSLPSLAPLVHEVIPTPPLQLYHWSFVVGSHWQPPSFGSPYPKGLPIGWLLVKQLAHFVPPLTKRHFLWLTSICPFESVPKHCIIRWWYNSYSPSRVSHFLMYLQELGLYFCQKPISMSQCHCNFSTSLVKPSIMWFVLFFKSLHVSSIASLCFCHNWPLASPTDIPTFIYFDSLTIMVGELTL